MTINKNLNVYIFTNIKTGEYFSAIGVSVNDSFFDSTGENYSLKNSQVYSYRIISKYLDYNLMYSDMNKATDKAINQFDKDF